MTLSKVSNIGQLVGVVLYILITVIEKWATIVKWGEYPLLTYLSFFFLIVAIIASAGVYYTNRKGTVSNIAKLHFPKNYKFLEVVGKKFRKENVPLDGHCYDYCEFRDVSFEWNGTAPFQLKNSGFYGFPDIKTKSAAVSSTITLLKCFKMLKEDIPILGENGHPFVPDTKTINE
jgi:hypothetical protein